MHVSDELKLSESYCVRMVTNKKIGPGGKTSTGFCTKTKQLQLPGHAIDCQRHAISLHSGEENLFYPSPENLLKICILTSPLGGTRDDNSILHGESLKFAVIATSPCCS